MFFSKKTSSNNGFTLIEVLVVMIVIAALIAITWSGFLGLRTAMALHQTGESFRSDVVYAQRSAMLLKRNPGENWVRGVLIDLRELVSPPPGENAQYSIRKWCAPNTNYLDFQTIDPILLTVGPSCDGFSALASMGYEQKKLAGGDLDVCITDMDQNPTNIVGILFEAVNGRPHFYYYDPGGYGVESFRYSNANNVRIAFFRGDRWDAVIVYDDGKIELETWDSSDPTACVP